jgi:hypothetical protein
MLENPKIVDVTRCVWTRRVYQKVEAMDQEGYPCAFSPLFWYVPVELLTVARSVSIDAEI